MVTDYSQPGHGFSEHSAWFWQWKAQSCQKLYLGLQQKLIHIHFLGRAVSLIRENIQLYLPQLASQSLNLGILTSMSCLQGNIPESFPFSKLQASTLTFLEQKHSPQRLKNEALGVCFTSASVSLQDMCKEESRNEERIGLGSFLYIHTEMLLQTPQDLYVRLIGSLCEHLFL